MTVSLANWSHFVTTFFQSADHISLLSCYRPTPRSKSAVLVDGLQRLT